MHTYTPHSFNIPSLDGISDKQIEEHLKLYEGYVKHVNELSRHIKGWIADRKTHAYPIRELWRRLGFEFNGMRNHEYYFGALENGASPFEPQSAIGKALIAQYKSYDAWKEIAIDSANTRGSGWVLLYYDALGKEKPFILGWVDEHHLGTLSTLPIILAIDCWEHAYMIDRLPSERGQYVDAYLKNINWQTVDEWYQKIAS